MQEEHKELPPEAGIEQSMIELRMTSPSSALPSSHATLLESSRVLPIASSSSSPSPAPSSPMPLSPTQQLHTHPHISAKAQDLLWGGRKSAAKSQQARSASNSWSSSHDSNAIAAAAPSSSSASPAWSSSSSSSGISTDPTAALFAPALGSLAADSSLAASHSSLLISRRSLTPRLRSKEGKIYDVLGESRAFIDTFRANPKAMLTLGALERHQAPSTSASASSSSLSPRPFSPGSGRSRQRQRRAKPLGNRRISERFRGFFTRAPLSPMVTSSSSSHSRANKSRQRAALQSRSTPSSPHPSSSSSSATSSSLPVPQVAAHPQLVLGQPQATLKARGPLPRKAANVLFGSKPRSKLNERLGMSVAMMDRFAQHPKAFQRLGLFDAGDSSKSVRMNAHGVVISGMRQLRSGHLLILTRRGPLVSIRKRFFVLTLDALTMYANESIATAEAEVSLLHGALVKRARDVQMTRRGGLSSLRPSKLETSAPSVLEEEGEELGTPQPQPQQHPNITINADGEQELALGTSALVAQETVPAAALPEGAASSPPPTSSSSTAAPSTLDIPASSSASTATQQVQTLYGFTVTPLRPTEGDARSIHLLSSDRFSALEWMRTLQSTLRRGRHRSVAMMVHSSSRSSHLPHELNYLHARSCEGYLFRWQASGGSAALSMPFHAVLPSTQATWQSRYVIVSSAHLTIFSSVDDTSPAARARGRVPLFTMSLREASILDAEATEEQSHVFLVIGHRVHNRDEHHRHTFAAASAEEKSMWMQALSSASGSHGSRQCSSTVNDSSNKFGDSWSGQKDKDDLGTPIAGRANATTMEVARISSAGDDRTRPTTAPVFSSASSTPFSEAAFSPVSQPAHHHAADSIENIVVDLEDEEEKKSA